MEWTNRHTVIVTYRLNQLRGRLRESKIGREKMSQSKISQESPTK